MSTLPSVELGVLGPLQVRQDGAPVPIPGAKPRAILTMLGLHNRSVVSADTLIELLWGDDPPRTAAKALQTHISSLRRTLGEGVVVTEGAGWTVEGPLVDASRYKLAARTGRDAAAAGDTSQAVARFEEALTLWRGIPELPDSRRGLSEKTRWIEGHAALVEDRADALLATGRAAEVIGDLEAAVAEAPLRERRWGQLMLALYRAGRQGEALGAYQRARSLLADELGVDPGPELRRLESAVVAQDASLDIVVAQQLLSVTRAVTFLLTDIEGSTAAWEANADAMAAALARHDELVEQVVTSRGGRLIKTRGEGDATFSVFERPSAAAAAAIELQDAISHEPWALPEPIRVRVALHTGEVELRDGDYFGRAVNRAARLRSLAEGGQILCSGASAELVIDSLPDDVALIDLGMRQLRNLTRPEHVFELRLETADDGPQPQTTRAPMERPGLPAVLIGPGPFVGRRHELEGLLSAWQTALTGGVRTVLIAGEPGVGKTRLAGEWSQQAYEQGAVVLYGRCDEDLGAPYQPFAEALRSLVPCIGASRLRGLRGIEALLPLVPGLTDVLPDLATPTRADPDTERYALFDAVVALFGIASASAPIVLILDDLHWAAKPTLLLLRHVLRFGEEARVQIVGTYRSTDLDRSHPLAAMLADLHRDGTANRLSLSGLDEEDVTAYVAEAGYDDQELAHALASVTGGNPFFLIEALRHVDESGGVWDQSTLPQGVREAVSRRLSRLPAETNKALATAAVVGSRFALELVERVVGDDLIDAFDEASKAGIVIEEPGGHYRFNHAIVRQSLLAELASVRRMRLHQRIATTLESQPGADDELLAELAHHYFECAWAGNAAKAVFYCRRAADQAMARLAYEGAADLYDHALHALEELDDELPDRDDQTAELLIARCEALLAAGDVASAAGAVSQLQKATVDSARLAAWATCFDGQLSMLIHPERLGAVEAALGAAAERLAGLDDAAGEAKAHTVRAYCLARLGRIGDCEIALDDALTAARRAGDHRRVNAVLAGAPLAALWGPNPVPRAGGRCLDVVRLLRITTDSPAVEATSTRCQAVLEAFRGRAAPARRMIDSARRTVTELGLRHALLEVEQFAGIVELVVDDPAAAEPRLRLAYNGFRRMGLDADTAETAALLGRTCLALDREDEAEELCTESERLAGHALKASIAWRTLRAQLLARLGDRGEARRIAEAAVALAERTDLLVDHGDACLTLATVLDAVGDTAGARAAAELAADLYERKGAAALAENARRILSERDLPSAPAPPQAPSVELDNACVRAIRRGEAAIDRETWDEYERLFAPGAVLESRRKIVGFTQNDLPDEWLRQTRRLLETGAVRIKHPIVVIAVRGERLALARMVLGTADVSPGAPYDEVLLLFGIDEDSRIALQMSFDIEDIDAAVAELDAAHARLEEPRPRTRRLENSASRIGERLYAYFVARDWDAITEILADNISTEDRRRVVNSGLRKGRDDVITEISGFAEIGVTNVTSDIIATRGGHLVLSRARSWGHDQRPEAFHTEVLHVIEINADKRVAALVAFDLDDFDGAIAELDARYLAGEAAAHARTWSVITGGHAAVNRRELPPTTPDCVSIDHRRGTAFAPGELTAYFRAGFDLDQDIRTYVEIVHRLSDLGAVCTHAGHGVSREGFDAEWLGVDLLTVEGDMVNRCEVFDEADLNAALAKFDQLGQPAPRLENAASQIADRVMAHFTAREWDAATAMLADDFCSDDRRRTVNAGLRRGRDAAIKDAQANADLGATEVTSTVIATRGDRLVLRRARYSDSSQRPEAFYVDALSIYEINGDGQVAANVTFDIDDIDAALEELDARYLAGEAVPYARTWSVIMQGYASLNRRELPPTTPDWVNIDHRRGTSIAPGGIPELLSAAWNFTSDLSNFVEAVHRLDNLGGVVTHVANETSQEGFHAEWRVVSVFTVEGDMVNRCEVFDEAAIDAALARFEELHPQARRLENAASRTYTRLQACFANREWDAMAEILADDICTEDRRRVVNSGLRQGRDAVLAELSAITEIGVKNYTSDIIAVRGEYLVLSRARSSGRDQRPEAFHTEVLDIVEVDGDGKVVSRVAFDPDDFGAAIAELDARYVAGEAAPYARTWSAIARAYATITGGELAATTPGWVNIDHRRAAAFAPGDANEYIRAAWDLTKNLNIYVEDVYRLSDLGAVVAHAARGTSLEGFDAEWRAVNIFAVEGDKISRTELFDEADLDIALARFDDSHPQTQRLESVVAERFVAQFAARDWDAMAQLFAGDYYCDDRRRVVNAGVRRGRGAAIEDLQVAAGVGLATNVTSTVIAARGERLILTRFRVTGRETDAVQVDVLQVVEHDADERIAAAVIFDVDNIDAAFAELETRYIAGEAATHSRTWSAIARAYATFNRGELFETTADFEDSDHRRGATMAPGDLMEYLRTALDQTPDLNIYIEAVHRLSDKGAVLTHAADGTSREGFNAEWREISLMTADGDTVNRCELFDELDIDAALARFEELQSKVRPLENAASQVLESFLAHFTAGDWDAMAELLADKFSSDDRRRVVGAGIRHGRDAQIADMRAIADLGITNVTPTVMATRGGRLLLIRVRFSDRDQAHEAFLTEALGIVEINADERIVALVSFDINDIDGAFEELETRYIAGEAAAHAHMWSLVADAFAAINRHQIPATTPNYVIVDHQLQHATIEAAALTEYLNASWDLTPDLRMYIEAVHQLTDVGAVITLVLHGTSPEGFDADWRIIELLTGEGDVGSRCEVFGEADLAAALSRLEELRPRPPRLENAASRVTQRCRASLAARDWDAMAEILAEGFSSEDRRRVVNSGMRLGRDVGVKDLQAAVDVVGIVYLTSVVLATRGERLELISACVGNDERPEAVQFEILQVTEIDSDERIAAVVTLDGDDIHAAFAELDARYLAGEAAAHAHTWSVIAGAYTAVDRHEVPATTSDWTMIDHRPIATFEAGDLPAFLDATWALTSDIDLYIEAVHRLSDLGAVVTHASHGTSHEGLDVEWHDINLVTVDGDLLDSCEIFDRADLGAALARFDELHPHARRLENAASRVNDRFFACFAARNWAAIAEILADGSLIHDRRRVVNAGLWEGRDVVMANLQAVEEAGTNITSSVIATRGERLVLTRICSPNRDPRHGEFGVEMLGVAEIDSDERIVAHVVFEPDDIDAAFEELDARYLAGEAAVYPHTWSVVARECAAFNRHELPAADWVTIDHRLVVTADTSDMPALIRAVWDLTPDLSTHVEAVHRLSSFGAVITRTACGTSHEGFDAEWRMIQVLTVEGDRINSLELFDEADLDAAIARFEELHPQARRLENAASRVYERFMAHYEAQDWNAIAETLSDDHYLDDRRRVVNAGIRHGRDAEIANMQTAAGVGTRNVTSVVIATRGTRLALSRSRFSGRDQRPDAFHAEVLNIVEIDPDERIAAFVLFDLDDMDAAFQELDARYLAGEASAHSGAWSVIAGLYAGFNRHELPATTPDWIYSDHRPLVRVEASDLPVFIHALWEQTSDISIHMEAVHRLNDLGAVVTHTAHGISHEDFDAEWRMIDVFTVEGDLISRLEMFDEADLDGALARFDELDRPTST